MMAMFWQEEERAWTIWIGDGHITIDDTESHQQGRIHAKTLKTVETDSVDSGKVCDMKC